MKAATWLTAFFFLLVIFTLPAGRAAAETSEEPFLYSQLLFPLEHWHNHASSIVELPNGDLLVCWYHGSGERTADDVMILGARKRKGSRNWSSPFPMEDTPGYPDTNPTLFLDPRERLWLVWPTILANEWHTALLKYRISTDYLGEGPPRWEIGRVLHVTPGDRFRVTVEERLKELASQLPAELHPERTRRYLDTNLRNAADKFYRRLGWMTRAHPLMVGENRLLLPLYSDGFSFSLMAISDDGGETWSCSTPLVGLGNIQPTLARRQDGSLVAYMRDNGPAPKRMQVSESSDRGETWTPVIDSDLPNPGSGAEVLTLHNGYWALVYNDLEQGRYSLAVALSDDEGKTWRWKRHLERDPQVDDPRQAGQYHYPSIIQGRDGTLHVTYSYFLPPGQAKTDSQGRLLRKSIKYAHFNLAWIQQGPAAEKPQR